MNILLINTSTYKIEFGYFENNKVVIEKTIENEYNADLLIYIIYKNFREIGKNIKYVEAVSMVNGPGSFTGLRVGSSIAKGICSVTNSLFFEINTLDLICKKYKDTVNNNKIIVPLIPANTKEMEFYYAEYTYINGLMNRISDYNVDTFDNIYDKEKIYLINENTDYNFPEELKVFNLQNISNIKSQFEITKEKIQKREESDYRTTEPFYIKKFTPLKNNYKT